MIIAALAIARETNGAFDPTVGPLVALWGFGPDAALEEPTEQEIERQRARVGWPLLAWDREGRLVRRVPGVQLDLSAIAKGYAVDAIVRELVRDRPAACWWRWAARCARWGRRCVESPGAWVSRTPPRVETTWRRCSR